ncbi:Glyceraldehyde-3-phosphate dehydrogenase protein [Marine Group I thaumarchaeote SCGC AAA799-D07]|nr:Glyceraldehyde-3-phosphate dehydrogenase protein [Marine Group I thaumarchaeote SCGC AAA799-D07]
MKKVFVNGYGSIGNRIAKFIKDDSDIILVGIGKHSSNEKVQSAIDDGFSVYVPEDKISNFGNYDISGSIESILDDCDLVIDASPEGKGFLNKKNIYEQKNVKVIFQGGETIFNDNAVADILFNSRVNYTEAFDKKYVMQGSCNVTGMGRILNPIKEKFADKLVRFDVTLVRRWADLEQSDKQIVDTIEMTQSPHHGKDVKAFFGKNAPLFIRAIKVPTRQMHLHIMDIRFNGDAPKHDEIHKLFENEYGIAILWTAKGTKDVRDFAESTKFNFKDTNMLHIHANMTTSIGDTIQLMYSDDQTGIVIPENYMLLQAMLFQRDYNDALKRTEKLFNMDEKKKLLEKHFSKS